MEDLSIDFIEGLPSSKGYTTILVVVDRFSNYVHFIPIKHLITTLHLAQVSQENIFKVYGIPKSITSDRDRLFLSEFGKEICQLQGTHLQFSSAYQPQTDGQTERVNQCLESFLRCFCSVKSKNWSSWLHWAQYWYNINWHATTGFSSCEVVYGRPPSLLQYIPKTTRVQAVVETLYDRDQVLKLLKGHYIKLQVRMQQYADQKCTEREFKV